LPEPAGQVVKPYGVIFGQGWLTLLNGEPWMLALDQVTQSIVDGELKSVGLQPRWQAFLLKQEE
jgi:hypothetical protein